MSWRPRNETELDLQRELEAAGKIEREWNVEHLKLGEFSYRVDWAFFRHSNLVGFGEFRWRAKQYDTLLLGASKWMKMCDISAKMNVPVCMFLHWDGIGLHYYRVDPLASLQVVKGGGHRGQNGDIEPVVLIPISEFKFLAD